MHILHVEAIIMAYFVHFCAYNCIFKAYFCIFPDIFAHLLHMSAYFRHIFEFCCLFQLILCISMHIYCIFEYTNAYKCIFHLYRSHGQLRAFPGPFLFNFTTTALYQHCIARKHTHHSGSGDSHASPGLGSRGRKPAAEASSS